MAVFAAIRSVSSFVSFTHLAVAFSAAALFFASLTTMSTTPATPATSSNLVLRPRRSDERGHADHGWLNSYHTFSFADYDDSQHLGFGSLRVINEDRVAGGKGFGRHPHRDFEIFSYVLSGALKHDDSMGNSEVLTRGDVQFTSAGRGIAHSEYNGDGLQYVHFLQMWVKPHTHGLPPTYQTRRWTDDDKRNRLRLLIAPQGEHDSIRIAADCRVYATLLDSGASVELQLAEGRRAYVHVAMDVTGLASEQRQSGVTVSGGGGGGVEGESEGGSEGASEGVLRLQDGDGCYVQLRDSKQAGRLVLTGSGVGSKPAEVIVFDLA